MFYEKKRLKQEGCFIYHGGDNPVMRHCVPWEQCRVGQEGERKEKAGSFESKNYGIKFNVNMSSLLILTLNIYVYYKITRNNIVEREGHKNES